MATSGSMGMGEMGMKPRMMGPMAPSIDPRMMGPGGMAPSMGPFAPSLPPMDPRKFPPMALQMMMQMQSQQQQQHPMQMQGQRPPTPMIGPFNPPPPPMGSSVKNLNNHLNASEKNKISGCPLDYLVTMGTTEPQTTVPSGKKPEIFSFNKFKIIVRDDQGLMN